MAVSTGVTDKQYLQKTTMQVKDVWRTIEIKEYIFRWTIPNFNNLKKNVEYENKSDKLKWSFTIVKKSSLYEVTIYTDDYDKGITCSVLYEDYICSSNVIANRIDGGVYKVNFRNSVIKAPSNLTLRTNKVVLVFRFNESEMRTLSFQPKAIPDACHDFMKINIKRMLQRSSKYLSPDFVIHVKEERFEVHKAILAARCSYFHNYIQDNCKDGEIGEIKLDVTSSAMYNFLRFIYTGRLRFSTKKKFFELCDLFYMLRISMIKLLNKRSWQDKRACTTNSSK